MEIIELNSSDSNFDNYLFQICNIEKENFIKSWKKEDFLQDINKNQYSKYFILKNENDVVLGYIGIWIIDERGEIVKLAIDKKLQNQGYANKMMKYIDNIFILNNVEYVSLEVRISNINALKLYKSNSYNIEAIRKNYYDNGEDAYLLLKVYKEGEQYESIYISNRD